MAKKVTEKTTETKKKKTKKSVDTKKVDEAKKTSAKSKTTAAKSSTTSKAGTKKSSTAKAVDKPVASKTAASETKKTTKTTKSTKDTSKSTSTKKTTKKNDKAVADAVVNVEEPVKEEKVVIAKKEAVFKTEEPVIEKTTKSPSGLEKYEDAVNAKSLNTTKNLILVACAALALILCFRLFFPSQKTIKLSEEPVVSISVPAKWYPAEGNSFYELKDGKLSFKLAYVVNSNVTADTKEKFFTDIRTYYDYIDLEDENCICLIDKTGPQDVLCFFKYIPEKEVFVEADFEGIDIADAKAILAKIK